MDKWDVRFLKIAKEISTWSKDPSTKVGAIAVGDNKEIIAQGYNGFPRGIDDSPERYTDRDFKYKFIVHAEANTILNSHSSLKGTTMYIYGLPCCNECAKLLVQSGIKKVVHLVQNNVKEKWMDAYTSGSAIMFKEAGIESEIHYGEL